MVSRGFTLLEIMIVVVILGILAALIAPAAIRHFEKAQWTKVEVDLQALEGALTLYRIEQSRYPTTDQGLRALVDRPADPGIRNYPPDGYLQRLRNDPWGNPYQYRSPGDHGPYDIYTLGADSQPGGDSNDRDFGNWELE